MSSSFSISNNAWDFDFGLYFRTVDGGLGDRVVAYAQPVQMIARKHDPVTFENPEPMMRLQKDDLQQLMDELWRVGIRPSEGSGSAGAMLATQRHLEDMRALVFKTKPVAKAPL